MIYLFTGCRLCRRALIEKIDVGGIQNSTFGGGITRFGCLELPNSGFSLIFVDFHRFLLIFIDFHGFGRHPKPGSLAAWRSLDTTIRRESCPYNKYCSILEAPNLDKTMIRCIGPGGSDSMHGALRHWN